MTQVIESASKTKPRFCFATMKNSMDGVFQSILNCSHGSRELVKIITLYEPSPMIWLDFRIRSKENG